LLAILLGVTPTSANDATLADARTRLLRGNYEEARALYEAAARDPALRPAAAVGQSRAWQSQGDYDKALAVLDDAIKDSVQHADLHARRAELLYLRGRWADAEKAVEEALALDPGHFAARWVRAQLYRDRGDLKKADAEFRWFVRTYTARSDADKEIKDSDQLLLVGLAGCENARWNNLPDQFQFILTDVLGDALKADKNFWPAEYQAGVLLLEKYNRAEAASAFDKALALNPSAAEALAAKGQAALQKLEFQEAEQFADRALRVDPSLVEALHVKADVYLAAGDLARARAELDKARAVNPRDEATLGRLAACLQVERRADELDKLVRDVEEYDAKPGRFHLVLAHQLEDRRRFDLAEKHYQKATELWPMLPAARSGLGLLYMRMGREADARPLLEKAFQADTFNVRVANTLKVLRHLERYETTKTPHFELRFDPQSDRYLARYMARYLEEVYADLAAKYDFPLAGPVLVEVFSNHEMFSGRTVALPDLHTVGACTGRVLAMVSPHGKGVKKPFNWARVVRHELTHIFNLEQTGFHVPHWFTEGLAVVNEGYPRPADWNRLLAEKVAAGDLLTLGTIDLAFVRPRSPQEWQQAYCQGRLYVEYLQKRFGPPAVGALLAAFRDGLGTAAAIDKVCKVGKEQFEKGYREHLQEEVRSLKIKPAGKPLAFIDLQEAYEKDPADPDLTAQLAEQYLVRRRSAEARRLADTVLAKEPGHGLAAYVKARLLLAAGDEDGARGALEAALQQGATEPKLLHALGRAYADAKEFAKAAEVFELGRHAEPEERQWLAELARVYGQAGDKEKQIAALRELLPTDPDDLDGRKQLARRLLDAGRSADAERYARQALEIDVLDRDARRTLGESLLGQKKADAAAEAFAELLEIDAQADDVRLRLAQAYLHGGHKEKARVEIERVLARDPVNAEALGLRKAAEGM
jgi:tetratricopeptide (TPR) repeat protein